MSELNLTAPARGQLAAIADLRWRLFINSLRTTRGKLEFLSRGLVSLAFLLGGLGGCFSLAAGTFYFLSAGKPELLALLLWPVFSSLAITLLFRSGSPMLSALSGLICRDGNSA